MTGPRDMPVLGQELGAELCRVFGLDVNRTRKITLTLEAGHLAELLVEQTIVDQQAGELVEMSARYGLHRIDDRPGLSPGLTVVDASAPRMRLPGPCGLPGCDCRGPQ